MIQNNLDPKHELIQLSRKIDWDQIIYDLRKYYSSIGRKAKRIWMMVALHMLKHLYDRSEEQVVEELRENVYRMAFCEVPTQEITRGKPLQWLDSSTMTYFRKRIGGKASRRSKRSFRINWSRVDIYGLG
jgi:IS5 family transposase